MNMFITWLIAGLCRASSSNSASAQVADENLGNGYLGEVCGFKMIAARKPDCDRI